MGPQSFYPALGVTELSISGFSSGTYFSHQMQISYSDIIKKVRIMSGGLLADSLFFQYPNIVFGGQVKLVE